MTRPAFAVSVTSREASAVHGTVTVARTGKVYWFAYRPEFEDDGLALVNLYQASNRPRRVPLSQLRDVRHAVRQHFAPAEPEAMGDDAAADLPEEPGHDAAASQAFGEAQTAHGFTRGQCIRIRDGYDFSGQTRTGEVVTQMHGAQPAWAVRCEFGGAVHYLRPDGIELAPRRAMVPQPAQPQQADASRRTVLGSALSAFAAVPAFGAPFVASPRLRGDDTTRLPDHADLWARMPLPFTPAEAWRLLSPATQAEIGAAVIGMALAEYVAGDGREDEDQFHDEALRGAAIDVQHDLLNAITPRLWVLLPDLYGPDGDHPAWALDSGMASGLPEA